MQSEVCKGGFRLGNIAYAHMTDNARRCNVQVESSVFQLEGPCLPTTAEDIGDCIKACFHYYAFSYVCSKLQAEVVVEDRSRHELIVGIAFFIVRIKGILPRNSGAVYVNVFK